MAKLNPIGLDFETLPIQHRPDYPPKPVSFSLKLPEWRKPRFFAWGHKTGGNNCSEEDARRVLTAVYQDVSDEHPLLCHNAKFDLDVAAVHFGLRLPPWHQFQDTMLLLFLVDPHARELGLKAAATKRLGLPPDEQDAVKAWVLSHKRQLEAHFPEIVTLHGGIKPSTAGAFIAYAPGGIVEAYADGDLIRTHGLFTPLMAEVIERGMAPAYDRERRILPIMLRNEAEGIRVDEDALARDQVSLEKAQDTTDSWLRKALKAPGLDFNKDADVAKALYKADAVKEWSYTATGRMSVSRRNLKLDHFCDPKVASAYSYRQKCATMLETFIRPWQAYSCQGWMNTTWHLVRGNAEGNGTRTGRPSSSHPNFLNVPRTVAEGATAGYIFPKHIAGLPPLPRIRSYILPDAKGWVVGKRDIHSQELRIFAHFEDGRLLEQYLKDPWLDVHQYVRSEIEKILGYDVGRPFTKTLVFGGLYGMGLGKLAEALDKSVDEVKAIRDAQLTAMPGMKDLSAEIRARYKAGQSIRTWGGRLYECEPPMTIDGHLRTFEYKGLNHLVQSSSADVTKQWIINYDEAKKEGRFLISVYDEVDITVPKKALKSEMLALRDAALNIDISVPMLTEGEWGYDLGNLEDLKEAAPDLSRWSVACTI